MSRITEQLLRKRAEHNEGMLTSLEEVSLHQQEIMKIQNLDVLCRHLKILYLQNNIIEKLQNLNKLKELEYLNVALNNISKIQNIEGCESLKKLDFTVNFIDAEDLYESVKCLSKLPNIKELYLTGNPCEDWKGCQDYVVAKVPQLESYNGTTITPSQRIKATQQLPALERDLEVFAETRKIQKKRKEAEMEEQRLRRMAMGEKEDDKKPYTKEVRREMYYEMAAEKEKKDKERNPQKYEEKKETSMYLPNGEMRQCWEGKYEFKLREDDDPEYSFFDFYLPKFMDSKDCIVNLFPFWVSIRVKGKLTQIRLNEEVVVSESKTERSQVTGIMTIKMKKLQYNHFLRAQLDKEKKKIEEKEKEKKQKQIKEQDARSKRLKLCEEFENRATKKQQEDDDEVPPLE